MSFDSKQIYFLQRLVKDRPAQRKMGLISRHFCEDFSLGVLIGHFIEYRDEDYRMAEELLRMHDLPVEALAPGAGRADVAVYGGLSEKMMSAAPHAGSVAIKCIGECVLDSDVLLTPKGSYLVVTPEIGRGISCDRLLLVENLETFRQLERYNWIDYRDKSVLVVYRGDSVLSTRDATQLLRSRSELIWAFVDFDPAGLVIANSLPSDRLERIILPDWSVLRQLANTLRGRQLFDDQESRARQALERAMHPAIRDAWGVLSAFRCGVTQERMFGVETGVLEV